MKRILYSSMLLLTVHCLSLPAFSQSSWKKDLTNYIQTKLAKPDGGYGWEDQYDSHSTVCFAVTGVLYDINSLPKNKAQLAGFIRTHHPQKGPNHEAGPSGSDLRNLTYEQIQAILWLGGEVSSFAADVSTWKSQAGLLANYEENKYPVLYQEAMIPICQKLINVPLTDQAKYIQYYQDHRRANGSFNNAPAAAGGDGNILNTYWSLYALKALDAPAVQTGETISWLQSCQLKNGGFTHQPNPQLGINDDVVYTWAGIKALKILDAKPKNVSAVIRYLVSLRSADGGFGNRPGLHSTPMSTYYAIDALKSLDAFSALDQAAAPAPLVEAKPDFTGYKTFTVQFEGNGLGSPIEAVMLAGKLKINLWGVKNAKPNWINTAQKLADDQKIPVTFFIADEPYGKSVRIPGMGDFEHIQDYIAPAKEEILFDKNPTFDEFKNTTLKKLKSVNGGLNLQIANNEFMARLILDDAINTKLGYMAISTIHFGQNFSFWLPYLMEYRYRLPLVTLQDAHGVESWWWANELTSHRNVFIAKEATYDQMITALKNNWIVGIRHDSLSNYKTRMLGGTEAARKFITAKEAAWKWWSTPDKLIRPQIAITVISAADVFEAGKPDTGMNIRVRCQWNTNREHLRAVDEPLKELKVDGKVVSAAPVIIKDRRNAPVDAYYLYAWGTPAKGKHTIEATVTDLKTRTTKTYKEIYVQN